MSSDIELQEPPPELSRSQLLRMTLLIEGGMLIIGVLLAYFLDYPFWENITLSSKSILLGALATLPMLIGVTALYATNWKISQQLRKDFDLTIKLFSKITLLDIAFISIMAGLCEEVLFRGFAQTFLFAHTGPAFGLIIASLIFGAFHFLSTSYVILVTIIGLYLGGLYLFTGDLLIPIIAHALYDFIAILYGVRTAQSDKT